MLQPTIERQIDIPVTLPIVERSDDVSIVVLVGVGTIGTSFAALHLRYLAKARQLTIYDPAASPDTISKIEQLVQQHGLSHDDLSEVQIFTSETDLPSALAHATIVQEQGPENLPFKQSFWPLAEKYAPPDALFWSSTSGIPASSQSVNMANPGRLLVVHPFNPPHIMPLLEIAPSPSTEAEVIKRSMTFWHQRGRSPVLLRKETTGFVANRLAFALLREAIHLVSEGVVGVEDLDAIVMSSMGPRWAVSGPFKSYAAGGGKDGLRGFFRNIGGTVQGCWDAMGSADVGGAWEEPLCEETQRVYGIVETEKRNRLTEAILRCVWEGDGV